jgi:Cu2+-containing amine oxidase
VREYSEGAPMPRRAEVHVLHYPGNRSWVAHVDTKQKRVLWLTENRRGVQPAISSEEYAAADAAVRAHEPWRQAVLARGVDPDHVYIDVTCSRRTLRSKSATRGRIRGCP